MPLFTRRSRSVSVSRPTTPSATNPAMLAASQAFNSTEAGQKRLAQGAAAAALRSMSPTATPVGQIQTKRMMERQSSVGAAHSAQRGRPNQMVRRNSSSSMTERTFREPSPGRPSTASGIPPSRQAQPPVPRLPDTYTNIPPIPKKTQRRSASIDEIGMRKSSAAGQTQPRNSSYTRAPPVNPASAAAKKVTVGQQSPALTRTDSNSSVNFSYPGRSRPISPPPQKHYADSPRQDTTPSKPVKPATGVGAISQTEARNIQRDLEKVAQQPVKKRKKRDAPLAEGSHLQAGGVGAKPKLHPLEPGPPVQPEVDDDSEPDRSRHRARLTGEASHFPSSPTSPNDASQASDSDSATERVKARRALRASGALQKQPSVVREDWEGEQEDVASSPIEPTPKPRTGSRKRQTPTTDVAHQIDTAGTPLRAEQEQRESITTPQSLTAPEARKPSLSPSRSTRFSNRLSSDMTQGQKHNPPPRSVSPRKPALKHSASPQGLAVDRARDSSLSPSEGTDVSYDGLPRRVKKSAHVKFDNHPEVVGISAEPDPSLLADSPVVVSPQYREQPKKWYAMSRKTQPRVALSDDSDDDDAMKPRPQLPTFGSVRNRRNDAGTSPPQPINSTPSSSSSSISSGTPPATMNTSISSDHAIGAMIAKDSEEKRQSPSFYRQTQVQPIETNRPARNAKDSGTRDNEQKAYLPVLSQQRTELAAANGANGEVPSIAVLPATPGTEEEPRSADQWLVEVPGGFPSANRAGNEASNKQATHDFEDHSMSAYDDHHEQIDRMSVIHEESDHDSVYSDAAEDLSDLEGDGFGSIAAIVHSPIASPTHQLAEVESPAPAAPQRNIEREAGNADDPWEDAGARWKGLAESAKRTSSLQPSAPIVERSTQQSQRTHIADDDIDSEPPSSESSPSAQHQHLSYHAVTTDPAQEQQSTFRRSMRTPTPELTAKNTALNGKPSEPVDFAPKTMRNSMRNSGTAAPRDDAPRSLRGSMRDSSSNSQTREDAPRSIRASMRDAGASARDDGPKPLRASMRDANSGVAERPSKATRASVPARSSSGASAAALVAAKPAPAPRATLQKKNPDVAPTLRKTLPPVQNDSDSESSFRKRRRAKANDTGRYSMRRSMRQEASPEPSTVDRRAVRSLSPVQRRPFSPSSEQVNMRTTMRGSSNGGDAPTLRNQNTTQRSSSLFGRRKDAKSPTRPMSLRMGSSSRVADSDDDRSNLPKVYKSRFQDSDDEDTAFTPVRGIPRKTRDDDSTDLEDSSDEEKAGKGSVPKKLSLATSTSREPAVAEPASPTSPDGKKKRGFFGRLRKSKDESKDGTAIPSTKEIEPAINGNEEKANGKQSANSAALGFNTDAEKEALIEETRKKLEAAKDQPIEAEVPPLPQPQAQRMTPQRHKSDSWPLVPKIVDENERPFTADGEASRPAFHRNSSSGTPTPSSPGGSSQGKSGKKKRFPLLRKAFGLKD